MDKTWAEFSTLEVAIFMLQIYGVIESKLPNLNLKTQPIQLLGSLPLDIVLPAFREYICRITKSQDDKMP
jgi:hypothetical protein